MSLRIKTWLLVGAVAAYGYACAEGVSTKSDESPSVVTPVEDAGEEEVEEEEEDAGEEEIEEDAGEQPEPLDAGMDTGASQDAGQMDAGASDAGMNQGLDAGRDAASSTPDTGAVDAGPDARRPAPQPLPTGTREGDWTYVEVPGAQCRDGSKAGYFHRKGDDNLMIFLNGSGACTDSFFCRVSPKSVNESFAAESSWGAAVNLLLLGPDATRQRPPNEGILKQDAQNPVATWSMIFVPYCTGDVHAGSRPNATVPGVNGTQQFVGYTNLGLFLNSFGPSFPDAQRVLLAGSGGGGFGALLNLERVHDYFAPQGAKVQVVSDSGIPFTDAYLEPCLQKRWRDLWNLDAILPQGCTGCRNANGGGLASGLGTYLFKERFKDRMMGGMVSSNADEIIRIFYSAGTNNCTVQPADQLFTDYPQPRFQQGLSDVINNVVGAERVAYYVMNAPTHMHLLRPRFYQDNGVGGSIASWLREMIAGQAAHRGNL